MLLRQSLERHLPLKSDEIHLSDPARHAVLRGPYLTRGKITRVDAYKSLPDSAYRLVVTRETEGGNRTFFGERGEPVYPTPMTHVAAEMTLPEALNRANGIEHKARQIKALVGGIAVTAALGAVLLGLNKCDGADAHQAAGAAYEQVTDSRQTLVPVSDAQAERLQQAGELVGILAGHEYEVGNR